MTANDIIEYSKTLNSSQRQTLVQILCDAYHLRKQTTSDKDYDNAIQSYICRRYPNTTMLSTMIGRILVTSNQAVTQTKQKTYQILASLRDSDEIERIIHAIDGDGNEIAVGLQRSQSFLVNDQLRTAHHVHNFEDGVNNVQLKFFQLKMAEDEKEVSKLVDKFVPEATPNRNLSYFRKK